MEPADLWEPGESGWTRPLNPGSEEPGNQSLEPKLPSPVEPQLPENAGLRVRWGHYHLGAQTV